MEESYYTVHVYDNAVLTNVRSIQLGLWIQLYSVQNLVGLSSGTDRFIIYPETL